MLTKNEAIALLNRLGAEQCPFSFYCDFLGEKWVIETTEKSFILEIGKLPSVTSAYETTLIKHPVPFGEYKKAFESVIAEINFGNSFLTNLTFQTPIETNMDLETIFQLSSARYKLLVPDQFVVFSPEIFIRIKENRIYSYPMKGTIDADIPNAHQLILADTKEQAEHITIVDLIRNDLSQVAEKVEVTRFRYIESLTTNNKNLLQVSSEIQGELPSDWNQNLGLILTKLLPAGSISGAPKPETIRIIQEVESYQRGFYTGICGHFDGKSLDSGVMIRFIKKDGDQFYYCSGGGVTSSSQALNEYQEMIDKVYLPMRP